MHHERAATLVGADPISDLVVNRVALVMAIEPGGPAAAAGIQPGDVILSIGGEVHYEDACLTELLFAQAPGDAVSVEVQRGAEAVSLDVVLGERPQPSASLPTDPRAGCES